MVKREEIRPEDLRTRVERHDVAPPQAGSFTADYYADEAETEAQIEARMANVRTEEMILNMGPQHPSTHGVLRLVLKLSGEIVTECVPVLGYLHRGIEKILENRIYHVGVRYTDQFDYVANMLNEHAYVGAAEQLLGLEVPRRAEFIRVIADEMSRCASHLIWLGTYLLDLGAFTPIVYCLRDREEILDMLESLCGARMNFNFFRIGGVNYDLPHGWLATLDDFLNRFERNLDEYDSLISGNEIFLVRTIDVGFIDPQDAIDWGLSGPMARGSGLNFDIRTFRPYSVYGELGVRPQVMNEGDAFARYKVRLNELRESIRLIRTCMEKLPSGPVELHLPFLIKIPKGETYYSIESSKGELGIYMISDGNTNPYRVKARGPSFVNLQILPKLLKGKKVGDVIAILGSIDIVLGEVDH